jgi:hypothetical protein
LQFANLNAASLFLFERTLIENIVSVFWLYAIMFFSFWELKERCRHIFTAYRFEFKVRNVHALRWTAMSVARQLADAKALVLTAIAFVVFDMTSTAEVVVTWRSVVAWWQSKQIILLLNAVTWKAMHA